MTDRDTLAREIMILVFGWPEPNFACEDDWKSAKDIADIALRHIAAARAEALAARQLLVRDTIAACDGCGGGDFPRLPNCQSCQDAVDERIADEIRALMDPPA